MILRERERGKTERAKVINEPFQEGEKRERGRNESRERNRSVKEGRVWTNS